MSDLHLVAFFLLAALAGARLTRLVVFDSYPPSVWLRVKWDDWTEDSQWNPLLKCGYCLSPWLVLALGLVGWFSGPHWLWWAFTAWMAASYIAAIVVAYDGDD